MLWIDIDWDFFVPQIDEFDSSDNHNYFLQEVIWTSRCASAIAQNFDLTQMMTSSYKKDQPEGLINSILQAGNFISNPALVYADSHMYIGMDLIDRVIDQSIQEIWHFDAHHDLVYGFKRFEEMLEQGDYDCGNWLGTLISQYSEDLREIHIVYPYWRRSQEEENDYEKLKDYFSLISPVNINFHFIDEIDFSYFSQNEIAGISIALSSGWTPPWEDFKFFESIKTIKNYFIQIEEKEMPDPRWRGKAFPRMIDDEIWKKDWNWISNISSIKTLAQMEIEVRKKYM